MEFFFSFCSNSFCFSPLWMPPGLSRHRPTRAFIRGKIKLYILKYEKTTTWPGFCILNRTHMAIFFYKMNRFIFCMLRFYLTMLMLHIRCTYIEWMFWLSSCVKKLWLKIWLQIQRSIFFKSHFQLQGQKIVRVDQTSHVPKFKSIIYRLYIKIYYIPQQYIILLGMIW